MLLLSRKRGEELVIGNGIRVTVLEVHGDRVKLGFVAPSGVSIRRNEIDPRARILPARRRHDPPRNAPAIVEMAMQRLRESPYKVMQRVSCEYRHGILFLRGRLFSFHEKQVAQQVVTGVRGVTQVVNEIEVD